MSSFDPWLEPLRAYPRVYVLVAFIVVAGAIVWLLAKVIKWSIYVLALLAFASATAAVALWLWG